MKVLLDTNAVIYFLKGAEKVVENLSKADSVAISFISEIELLCYDVDKDEMKNIKSFLKNVKILYPNPLTVKYTIDIRKKTGLKLPDALICAQSKQYNGDKLMFTIHHERWNNNIYSWTKELVWQNVKNVVKRINEIPKIYNNIFTFSWTYFFHNKNYIF